MVSALLLEARPRPAKPSRSAKIRDSKPFRQIRNSVKPIPTKSPIRRSWDWNSGSVSRPSSLATRNATDLDLRTLISVFIASFPSGVYEEGDRFLDRRVDLSLRIVDEYLDR